MSNEDKGGEKEKKGHQAEEVQHIKVPALVETALPGWFDILNAQFNLDLITQNKTKFYHALATSCSDVVSLKSKWDAMAPRLRDDHCLTADQQRRLCQDHQGPAQQPRVPPAAGTRRRRTSCWLIRWS